MPPRSVWGGLPSATAAVVDLIAGIVLRSIGCRNTDMASFHTLPPLPCLDETPVSADHHTGAIGGESHPTSLPWWCFLQRQC